jgi:hypothetical protein
MPCPRIAAGVTPVAHALPPCDGSLEHPYSKKRINGQSFNNLAQTLYLNMHHFMHMT